VLYKEYHQNCAPGAEYCNNTLYFLLGCAVTFSGVFLITVSPIKEQRSYLFDLEVRARQPLSSPPRFSAPRLRARATPAEGPGNSRARAGLKFVGRWR
jgi:hypothetical protein